MDGARINMHEEEGNQDSRIAPKRVQKKVIEFSMKFKKIFR